MSFYLMHRGWMEHHLFRGQPYSDREAWIYLIETANYSPTRYRQSQSMYDIPRGDIATSYRSLAEKWKWSTNKVIRFLKLLKIENMISLKTEHGFVQITICNYETYQSPSEVNGTQTEHARNTDGTRTDTGTNTNVIKTKQNKQNKTTKRARVKVSLNDLSVDHISSWLARKRVEGRYVDHDEYFILDYFKNYCESKGKSYDNYVAALQNAFEWDSCQPKLTKSTKDDRSKSAIIRGLGIADPGNHGGAESFSA